MHPRRLTQQATDAHPQIFEGFIEYCNNVFVGSTNENRFQLMPVSSWTPITLHRVYPYVYCPPSQINGCYEDLYSSVVLPSSKTPRLNMEDCTKTFDFIVTGMQYIDAENVAVSVLRSTPERINPRTLQPHLPPSEDNVTHTATYFLVCPLLLLLTFHGWC